MIAIQLHNYDEEIVGTVYTENSANYNRICEFWDEYLKKYENAEDIYQFEDIYANEIFWVLNVDFYQPSKTK